MVIVLKDKHFLLGVHDARTIGPFIFIAKSAKNNKCLIEHEKYHVKHLFSKDSLLYFFSSKARYRSEIEAYKVQLQCRKRQYLKNNPGANKIEINANMGFYVRSYARFMAERYNLGDVYDQAYKDLSESIGLVEEYRLDGFEYTKRK